MAEGTERDVIYEYLSDVLFDLNVEDIALTSDYELCAFLNSRIHNDIERANFSVSDNGVDVLRERKAVCGGMVIALKTLIDELDFKTELAYMIGGDVAHSMLQTDFEFGSVVFDPYFGVVFRTKSDFTPLGISEAVDAIQNGEADVYYVNKTTFSEKNIRFEDVYNINDIDNRIDYHFPDDYMQLEGWGTANSGFVDFVRIDLHPGTILGNKDWEKPLDNEPFPYTNLASSRRDDGRHLSWGYIMGQTGTGYHVQHIYTIKNPKKKKLGDFILRIGVCTAYCAPGLKPVITLQQIKGGKSRVCRTLEIKNSLNEEIFSPQIIEAKFKTIGDEAIIICHAFGDFVLNFLEIEEA